MAITVVRVFFGLKSPINWDPRKVEMSKSKPCSVLFLEKPQDIVQLFDLFMGSAIKIGIKLLLYTASYLFMVRECLVTKARGSPSLSPSICLLLSWDELAFVFFFGKPERKSCGRH